VIGCSALPVVQTISVSVHIFISSTSPVDPSLLPQHTASTNMTGVLIVRKASAAASTGGRQWPCSVQGNYAYLYSSGKSKTLDDFELKGSTDNRKIATWPPNRKC